MDLNGAKVLVTGSSGFIGQHLVDDLSRRGAEVYGLDVVRPQAHRHGSRFRFCDILGAEALKSVLIELSPHAVVHLAARTDLDETKDIRGYRANSDGVHNLIEAVRACGSVKRTIYTSSQLVCRIGYVPTHDRDYCPNTLYGASKVRTEQFVRDQASEPCWTIVRPTTVWGPGMRPHYQRFVRLVLRGTYFHISRRPLFKSYSYVKNIAHQYCRLLEVEPDRIRGKTLVLADYEPLSLRAWIEEIRSAGGGGSLISIPESVARLLALAGDALNKAGLRSFPFNSFRLRNIMTEYVYDMRETETICGPLPYSMKDGVRELVDWIRTSQG